MQVHLFLCLDGCHLTEYPRAGVLYRKSQGYVRSHLPIPPTNINESINSNAGNLHRICDTLSHYGSVLLHHGKDTHQDAKH